MLMKFHISQSTLQYFIFCDESIVMFQNKINFFFKILNLSLLNIFLDLGVVLAGTDIERSMRGYTLQSIGEVK